FTREPSLLPAIGIERADDGHRCSVRGAAAGSRRWPNDVNLRTIPGGQGSNRHPVADGILFSPANELPVRLTLNLGHQKVAAAALRTGGAVLGPLETRVLELLWAQQCPATVGHIRRALPELAYTTIMTTLDRLYRKGLLLRDKDGRAF